MRAVLVDDEVLALELMKKRMKEFKEIEVVGASTNPFQAREIIERQNVDVVFLDIHLPEINGLELAEKLLETNPDLFVVFVTAYDEYAVEAFEVCALDYLVKPVQADRLKATIKRLERYLYNKDSNSIDTLHVAHLGVNVLGQLSFELHKGEKKILKWRTQKSQELFLYLLHHRQSLVQKSLLIDLLWPDVDPEKALAQLYTTIYHVRKALSPYKDYFNIKNTTEGYILQTENIQVDAVEWRKALQAMPPVSADSIESYVGIMRLYNGGYLKEYNYWWAEGEKRHLEQLWLDTAMNIANFFNLHGNWSEAKYWYIKICKYIPYEEDAHFALMKLYAKEKRIAQVHKQYQLLEKELAEGLDMCPSDAVTTWYKMWATKS